MEEGGPQSRYVKLTKDQAPLEDIKPGELNQPIDVPQVSLSLSLWYGSINNWELWDIRKIFLFDL